MTPDRSPLQSPHSSPTLGYRLMICHEAVPVCIQAQVDFADLADKVGPHDMILPAAVLARLAGQVVGEVHEGAVKPH